MHRLALRRLGGRDDARDAQVALGRRRRPDADRLVGEADVQRVAVGGRVHRDGLDPELVERADHAHRDLAPVRDEDAGEHRLDDGRSDDRLELEEERPELDRLSVVGVDRAHAPVARRP